MANKCGKPGLNHVQLSLSLNDTKQSATHRTQVSQRIFSPT